MIGAIAGDIIGSYYKAFSTKESDFPLFHEDCRFTGDTDYETAVRNAVSMGGDADTMACIAGAIADAYHTAR